MELFNIMKPIDYNDSLLYFEEETGFLYEKKKYGNADYFIPLNFCTLECTIKKDKNGNNNDTCEKAVQGHTGDIQLRGEQKRQPKCWGLRPYVSLRNRTPRRIEILYNKCSHGIGAVYNKNIRRNGLHHVLGAPSPARVYGIRSQIRTKNNTLRKEASTKKEINGKTIYFSAERLRRRI